MGKSSDQPPPVDPTQTATAQGQANVQGSIANAYLNNPNVTTPYGQSSTSVAGYHSITMPDGSTQQVPTFNVNQSLSPAQQGILNSQQGLAQGQLDTAQGMMPGVQAGLSKPMDLSSVNDVYQRSYKNQTDLLDPQWKDAEGSEKQALANQGLVPGDEAYTNGMNTFNMGKNQAYSMAAENAVNTMPQTLGLAESEYTQPLQVMQSLQSGNPVQNPTFAPFQGSQVAPANVMGAQQMATQQADNIYNAQTGSNNATTNGIASIASFAAMAFI